MKIIFSALLIFFSVTVIAQKDKAISNEEFKALVGSWTGPAVFTGFIDGKNQVTYQTKLEVIDMKDSLQFNFTYTDEVGKQVTEKNSMYVYDNGGKLSFDSAQYDIAEIRRRGVRLTIYAEREGYEDYKAVDFQNIILIGPGILNITKGIRSGVAVDFAIRKRLTLTKK